MTVLGLIGSFFSGLLGIGGAIINYPLIYYVPSGLGVGSFTAYQVSAISMFQVFFASLAGLLAFRKKDNMSASASLIDKRLVLYMGRGIGVGSLFGSLISGMVSGYSINLVYGILAILAVILMLIPSRAEEQVQPPPLIFHRGIAVVSAIVVGIVSGIVGAGGAFILIPIMLTVLHIPARTTIASSLAIVFISAIGGVIGKLLLGDLPWLPILFTVLGSIIGAPLGSKLSLKMNVSVLRYGLLVLIALTAVKVWIELI